MSKHIIKFNNFELNEALGIADATTFYTNRLTYMIFEEFYNVIDNMRLKKLSSGKVSNDVRIGYSTINSLVPKKEKNSLYLNFPVSEILVTIDFEKREVEDCENPVMVGGSASPFARGREKHATRIKPSFRQNLDHTLSIHFGINIIFTDKFKKINTKFNMFDRTYLFKKIEGVISHELNHLYEYYMRRINKSDKINTSLTWASIGENIYDVPKDIFTFWQDEFTTYIYYSEPHEVNAQTQESKISIDKTNFENFRRKSKYWKEAKKMQNWSYKKFLDELSEKFKKDKIPLSKMDEMKYKFVKEYIKLSSDWNEYPKINPNKLYKMSNDEFYIFFEKVINNAGTKLIRNFCRLFALKELEKEN